MFDTAPLAHVSVSDAILQLWNPLQAAAAPASLPALRGRSLYGH